MMRRVLLVALAFVLVLTPLAGCKGTAEVVGAWPKAKAERTVGKPAEPPRWPLTGLDAPSFDAVQERVVSVKIENSAESRPQTNLQAADVVYESVTEGGITRFNAIFHSQAPDVVGPVRSARLSDIDIVPMYKALFAFSGASPSVNDAISAAELENLSQDAGVGAPYTRSSKRAAPHNLYSGIPQLRAEAKTRGMAATAEVTGFPFDRVSAESTPTITKVTIPFSNANTVVWTFDPASRAYLRVNNGKSFTDAATGAQLHATNVVVLWAQYAAASTDVAGSTTYDIELIGSGRASVFRGGQRYDCTWQGAKGAPPTFKAADGTLVKLATGNTWFQVINTDVNIAME